MNDNYQQDIDKFSGDSLESILARDYAYLQLARSRKLNVIFEYLQSLPEDSVYRRIADLHSKDKNETTND